MDFTPYVALGTYLALCASIYKIFEKGDSLITEDAKLEIAIWLIDKDPLEKTKNWTIPFIQWFDRVFTNKPLSWRCFYRSLTISIMTFALILFFWFFIRTEKAKFFNPLGDLTLYDTLILVSIPLLFALIFNVIQDYISLLETRFILGIISKSQSAIFQFLMIVVDFAVTVVISVAIPLSIILISYPEFQIYHYFIDILPMEPFSILRDRFDIDDYAIAIPVFVLFFSISFYTSFLTSLWLWSYLIAGLLLKLFTLWRSAKKVIDIEQKPLSYFGVVLIFFLTISSISALIFLENLPNLEDVVVNQDGVLEPIEAEYLLRARNYGRYILIDRKERFNEHHYIFQADSKIVFDKRTNLTWQRKLSETKLTYSEAKKFIAHLNSRMFCGFSNWRMPTIEEGMGFIPLISPKHLLSSSIVEVTKRENPKIFTKFHFSKFGIWTNSLSNDDKYWFIRVGPENSTIGPDEPLWLSDVEIHTAEITKKRYTLVVRSESSQVEK